MPNIVLDVTVFRGRFLAFASDTAYPTSTIQMQWDVASCFISPEDYGYLHGDCRAQAIMLMTAHLLILSDMAANGETVAMPTSASIDKVSVTLTPPPFKDQFDWWLSLTPYGAQLLAMLSMFAVGGLYVGGSNERRAFRKSGGRFL